MTHKLCLNNQAFLLYLKHRFEAHNAISKVKNVNIQAPTSDKHRQQAVQKRSEGDRVGIEKDSPQLERAAATICQVGRPVQCYHRKIQNFM